MVKELFFKSNKFLKRTVLIYNYAIWAMLVCAFTNMYAFLFSFIDWFLFILDHLFILMMFGYYIFSLLKSALLFFVGVEFIVGTYHLLKGDRCGLKKIGYALSNLMIVFFPVLINVMTIFREGMLFVDFLVLLTLTYIHWLEYSKQSPPTDEHITEAIAAN